MPHPKLHITTPVVKINDKFVAIRTKAVKYRSRGLGKLHITGEDPLINNNTFINAEFRESGNTTINPTEDISLAGLFLPAVCSSVEGLVAGGTPIDGEFIEDINTDTETIVAVIKDCLEFDGSLDTVTVPHIAAYQSSNKTIMIWARKSGSFGDTEGIIAKQPDTGFNADLRLYMTSDGVVHASMSNGSSIITRLDAPESSNDGLWHHLAAVKEDLGGGNFEIKLFVDFELVDSEQVAYTPNENTEQWILGTIATNPSGSQRYFEGRLSGFSVWNTALSEEDIETYGLSVLVGNEPNLVGYWEFDEGAGTTAEDDTANANDGTISGATYVQGAPILNS